MRAPSVDAHHLTGAPTDGEGAERAMRAALRQSELDPSAIDHVNAYATSARSRLDSEQEHIQFSAVFLINADDVESAHDHVALAWSEATAA